MTGAATLTLLAAAVVIASFVQGTIGVGFALILAPILGLLAPALLPGRAVARDAAAQRLGRMA